MGVCVLNNYLLQLFCLFVYVRTKLYLYLCICVFACLCSHRPGMWDRGTATCYSCTRLQPPKPRPFQILLVLFWYFVCFAVVNFKLCWLLAFLTSLKRLFLCMTACLLFVFFWLVICWSYGLFGWFVLSTTCSCTEPQRRRPSPGGQLPPASSWREIEPLWNQRISKQFTPTGCCFGLATQQLSSQAQSWNGDTSGTPGHSHFLILAKSPTPNQNITTSPPHFVWREQKLSLSGVPSPRPKKLSLGLGSWAVGTAGLLLGTSGHPAPAPLLRPLQQIGIGPVPSRRGTTHTYTWPSRPPQCNCMSHGRFCFLTTFLLFLYIYLS